MEAESQESWMYEQGDSMRCFVLSKKTQLWLLYRLCCLCGTGIRPNSANMCLGCIRKEVDITDGLTKQISLQSCRSCERYLNATGQQWIVATPESRELLGLCLKKLKLPSTVKLVDAGFLWTEPHSRRLKLKVSVQKQVYANTVLQQVYAVEVLLCNMQCHDCQKIMAKNTWKAVVQVRQKVSHKRTFLYLEQLILTHGAHRECTNIKSQPDGLDFFFQHRNHAVAFVDFLGSIMPTRSKTSEQLLSKDIHSGTASYKFTFSVELVPLCKDDVVALPRELATKYYGGSVSALLLVAKVGHVVHLLDPWRLTMLELPAAVYWRSPFVALANVRSLSSFLVLDVQPTGAHNGRYVAADIVLARLSDLATPLTVRSHLGRLLKPGDYALGYDIDQNLSSHVDDGLASKLSLLDGVLLLKKSYREARRRRASRTGIPATGEAARSWKLKFLDKSSSSVDNDTDNDVTLPGTAHRDVEMMDVVMSNNNNNNNNVNNNVNNNNNVNKSSSSNMKKRGGSSSKKHQREEAASGRPSSHHHHHVDATEEDLELFLQDIEQDEDLRRHVQLYKRPDFSILSSDHADLYVDNNHNNDEEEEEDRLSLPEIDIAELLDELAL